MTETKHDRIKTHFVENKKAYIGLGMGIAVSSLLVWTCKAKVHNGDTNSILNMPFFSKNSGVNIIKMELVERSTPSKPVHLVGTNLYFDSLSEASRQTGHSLSQISKHINGHISDLKGDVFELLEKT